jgi:hypothetical protein
MKTTTNNTMTKRIAGLLASSRTRTLGALGALAATALIASSERAAIAETPAPEHQVITNAVSNLCLGVRGVDNHPAGTGVEVYYCNPGAGDRGHDNQWVFSPAGDGYVNIKNRASNLCLGVRGVDRHTAGTEVEVYTCVPGGGDAGLDNQWRVVAEPDGFKRIENRVSGLCLGVRGVDQHGPGSGAEVYHCTPPSSSDPGRDNRWRFQGL